MVNVTWIFNVDHVLFIRSNKWVKQKLDDVAKLMEITKRHDLALEYERQGSTFYREDVGIKQAVYVGLSQRDTTSHLDFLEHAYGDVAFLLDLVERAKTKVKELQNAIETKHNLSD